MNSIGVIKSHVLCCTVLLCRVKMGWTAVLLLLFLGQLTAVSYGHFLHLLGRLFVLLVVYCYAAIAPILLPVASLLYLGSYLVYKNQALYVYVQTAESGGAVSL